MKKRERRRIEQSIKELSTEIAALEARTEPVAELLSVLQRAMADLDKRLTIYQALLVVEDGLSGQSDDQPMALSADVKAGIDDFLASTNEPPITVTSPAPGIYLVGDPQPATIHGKDDATTIAARTFQEDLAAIEAEETKALEPAIRAIVAAAGTSGKTRPMVQALQQQYPQYDIVDMVNAMQSHDGKFFAVKIGSLKTR